MKKVLIVYASSTGNTRYVADLLHVAFGQGTDLIHLDSCDQAAVDRADLIVACVSTWGMGEMQDDWEAARGCLVGLDFKGKLVAVCGLGDQKTYPEKFGNGARALADLLRSGGGRLVGQTSTEGYSFQDSSAVVQGRFVGLMIDEDSQHPLTLPRIEAWVASLRSHLRRTP